MGRMILCGFIIVQVALFISVAKARFLPTEALKTRIEMAIKAERPSFTLPVDVTGITVPHHLLAADLMARGFWAASGGDYDRIVLISPDHFRAVKADFGVFRQNIKTILGVVKVDHEAVGSLLDHDGFDLLTDEEIAKEHGVQAVLPFIGYFFPDVPIVPVVASIFPDVTGWKKGATALAKLITPRTLIIQSTDYSHYLDIQEAVQRDQETLSVIAEQDPARISALNQPAHMDSRAAQFIQMMVQEEVFKSHPTVIANRNSVRYGGGEQETTSYIVTVYTRTQKSGTVLRYDDQTVSYFAGDVLLGRYFTGILADRVKRKAIVEEVMALTGDAPLIINLEGVLLNEPVTGADVGAHIMMMDLAGPILHELGVMAASLANNHAYDFGKFGAEETRRHLADLGIVPLDYLKVSDLGFARILPLNFLRDRTYKENYIDDLKELEVICRMDAAPPLIVFVHWGQEYANQSSMKEREISTRLTRCGVSAIIGHHSHIASNKVDPVNGGPGLSIYSLGNFLFDQSGKDRAGALAELRVFENGTIALRLVPVGNFYRRYASP